MPKRSVTTKHSMATIRNKISSPLELISTTNMLSYNAPDIYPAASATSARSSSNSTARSGDDSDRSPTGTSTPMTSPDTSSMESSPTSLELNHLSCYFGGPSRTSTAQEAPIIPQRAVSHTKKATETLAHQRSNSQLSSSIKSNNAMSPKTSSAKSSSSAHARSSINMFAAHVETMDHHPFGKELAQVTEIAEEYGLTERMDMPVVNPEEQELISPGYFKFSAQEYIAAIQPCYVAAYGEAEPKAITSLWI